jgi:hypothetical protein
MGTVSMTSHLHIFRVRLGLGKGTKLKFHGGQNIFFCMFKGQNLYILTETKDFLSFYGRYNLNTQNFEPRGPE